MKRDVAAQGSHSHGHGGYSRGQGGLGVAVSLLGHLPLGDRCSAQGQGLAGVRHRSLAHLQDQVSLRRRVDAPVRPFLFALTSQEFYLECRSFSLLACVFDGADIVYCNYLNITVSYKFM